MASTKRVGEMSKRELARNVDMGEQFPERHRLGLYSPHNVTHMTHGGSRSSGLLDSEASLKMVAQAPVEKVAGSEDLKGEWGIKL